MMMSQSAKPAIKVSLSQSERCVFLSVGCIFILCLLLLMLMVGRYMMMTMLMMKRTTVTLTITPKACNDCFECEFFC